MKIAYIASDDSSFKGIESNSAVDRRRLGALIKHWKNYGLEIVRWSPGVKCDVIYIVSLKNSLDTAEKILANTYKCRIIGGIIEDPIFGIYASCLSNNIKDLKDHAFNYKRGFKGIARRARELASIVGLHLDPVKRLMNVVKRCDGIITTSEGQSTIIRQFNINTISIADCMPSTDFNGKKCRYSKNERITIAWEGTAWGLQLIELVRPALESASLKSIVPIEFKFIGPSERPTPLGGLTDNCEIISKYKIPSRHVEWTLDTIGSELSNADIGIAPMPINNPFYRNKAYSKPLSYMACGLPVIASPIPSFKEIVIHGETGLLANTQDEWIDALLQLINCRDLRRRIGLGGLKIAESKSCETFAMKLYEFFQYCIDIKSDRPH